MRLSNTVSTAAALVVYLAAVSLLSSGCQGSYNNGKRQHEYIRSQQDVKFQQGADQPPTTATLYSMAKILIHQERLSEIVSEIPSLSALKTETGRDARTADIFPEHVQRSSV